MPNDGLAKPLKVFMVTDKPCQTGENLDSHFPEVRRYEDGRPIKNWKRRLAEDIQNAKTICASCDDETRKDCLLFALDNNIAYGIWGGTTPDERKRIAMRRRVSNGTRN